MNFEDHIRRQARDFATKLFDNMAVGHPDEITAEWLMTMHPELSAEEAEEYHQFCQRSTIVFRGCYGEGSTMWPRWKAFKAEIASM